MPTTGCTSRIPAAAETAAAAAATAAAAAAAVELKRSEVFLSVCFYLFAAHRESLRAAVMALPAEETKETLCAGGVHTPEKEETPSAAAAAAAAAAGVAAAGARLHPPPPMHLQAKGFRSKASIFSLLKHLYKGALPPLLVEEGPQGAPWGEGTGAPWGPPLWEGTEAPWGPPSGGCTGAPWGAPSKEGTGAPWGPLLGRGTWTPLEAPSKEGTGAPWGAPSREGIGAPLGAPSGEGRGPPWCMGKGGPYWVEGRGAPLGAPSIDWVPDDDVLRYSPKRLLEFGLEVAALKKEWDTKLLQLLQQFAAADEASLLSCYNEKTGPSRYTFTFIQEVRNIL